MKTFFTTGIIGLILIILAAFGAYQWFFCRFYVPPGQMAIVTAKSGKKPQANEILVERGEKGIWKEVLPEGRYFLDPIMHEVKIVPAISIPIGKVGIVTSKIGKPLPPGEIIAPDRSSQGVWRNVLGPGTHRLNPQGYEVQIVDAINIPIGYVGVVTSQTGKTAPAGQFASIGEKGVLKDILQPGLYYINPRAYQVNVIEIGMNQISMVGREGGEINVKSKIESASDALQEMSFNTLNVQLQNRENYMKKSALLNNSAPAKQQKKEKGRNEQQELVYSINSFVEFPSRDGFKISMDMTVEFELLPEYVSKIYMLYGDLPQVVEKIILPQILSVSRLKGSTYKAQDFIMGEGRETFQKNLRQDLVDTLKEKNIIIHNAIIRSVAIPNNILKPIQDSSIAKEQNLTNFSLQETAKIEAELNSQTTMIEQKRKEVSQETLKLVAEIAANQKNAVRMIAAQTELDVAEIQLKRSEIEAKTARLKGETEVKVNFMKRNETAQGTRLKSQVLGELGIMADLKLIENLNPALSLKVIHAGEGTLWTDMKNGAIAVPQKK